MSIEFAERITKAAISAGRPENEVTLIAVSKQQPEDRIELALANGYRIYGENRVQEAQLRWAERKITYPDLELHLIGPLQSNKASDAVQLFDVIHSVDREKIAQSLATEMKKQNKEIDCFIQVNTGDEPQKSGISPQETVTFVKYCQHDLNLSVKGLMCIPPAKENPAVHFGFLQHLAAQSGLAGLSMGMSADYEVAIQFGATHIRVGSAIFGARP